MKIRSKYLVLLSLTPQLLLAIKTLGQAPNISYSPSINVYTVGVPITTLSPTNTGGGVPLTVYGQVTTFAGSTVGNHGNANGLGTAATFNNPTNLIADAAGNLYVADKSNNQIRKITPAGAVSLFAGGATGSSGFANGTGTSALFNGPYGIAIDTTGNLYVAEFGNNGIRKITPSAGVTSFAGSATGATGASDNTGAAASFFRPVGSGYAAGNLYVADFDNNEIRKITPSALVTTFAGNTTAGFKDATGTSAQFSGPIDVQVDGSGNLMVADFFNNAIRKITPAGVVTTFAGSLSRTAGHTNGTGTAALFDGPNGIAIDAAGNFYVVEQFNNDIRMITPAGVVTLLAGSPLQTAGLTDGTTTNAKFNDPSGMYIDRSTGTMYVADFNNNSIRKILLTGYTISPALPAGLSFDSTTGNITGTPTAIFLATTFTITGYNASGSSTTTVSLACGQIITWKSGGNTTAWGTNNNWSPAVVPGQNDAVQIGVVAYTKNNEPQITTPVTVNSITFGSVHNGTLTVASPGGTLTIGNNFIVNAGATPSVTGTGTLTIDGSTFTNNGTITFGTGLVTFGSAAAATLTTATLLTFNNLAISGGGTKTLNISGSGVYALSSTGTLTMSGNTQLVAGGNLTLNSDASGSAAIAAIPPGSGITGNVTVQRYITGGSFPYRGYRLLSSPVFAGTAGSNNVYSLNYLKNGTFLTGTTGIGGGFDKGGNPTLYLYRENLAPSNASFISGNFRGVNTIGTAPNFNYLIDGDAGTFNIPAGNGFLCFFRGGRTTVNPFLTTTVPVATTLSTTGTLNQGQVTVNDWYTPASSNLGFTNTPGNAPVQGFNLVGNPYPSSINWETFQTTTTTTGIYGNNISNTIYVIDPVSHNYGAYMKGGGGAGTNNASNIIASGQGFFVRATGAGAQLIFNESAKSRTQVTGPQLLLAKAVDPVSNNQYLRLQLAKDSVNTDDILIRFDSNAQTGFFLNEDAPYKTGLGLVSLASLSSDHVPLAINVQPLPKPGVKINLSINTNTGGIYRLNMKQLVGVPQLFDVWLMDAYKKDSLDMRHNATYSFNVYKNDTSSFGTKRFSLVIRQNQAYGYRLLNFTATKVPGAKQVQLQWITENEQNYTYFTVERSTDGGKTFNALGGLQGSSLGTYGLLDNNPVTGQNLYRLKQEDINNTVTYSSIVPVLYSDLSNSLAATAINVYPNPASSMINLTVLEQQGDNMSYNILITNNSGILIKKGASAQASWQTSVSDLLPGVYIIKVLNIKNNSMIGETKFVKL